MRGGEAQKNQKEKNEEKTKTAQELKIKGYHNKPHLHSLLPT